MNNREKVNALYEAVWEISHIYEKWSKSKGLSYYEMQFYYAILEREEESMTQKQLWDELECPPTTISSIVKKHEQLGYIQLEVNPKNKKEKFIRLTSKGTAFAHELIDPLFSMEEDAVSIINEDELKQINQVISLYGNRLVERMEK